MIIWPECRPLVRSSRSAKPVGHAVQPGLAVADRLDLVEDAVHDVAQRGVVLAGALVGDLVDLGLRLVDDVVDLALAGVADLHDLGAGVDQAAQDRLLAHDLGVVAGVGRDRHVGRQRVEVRRAADPLQLAAALELGGDGHHVDRLAAAVEVDDRVVDRLVRGPVEVDAAQHLGDVGDGVLGEQHRARARTARRPCPAAGCGRRARRAARPVRTARGRRPSPRAGARACPRVSCSVTLNGASWISADSTRWRSPDARRRHRHEVPDPGTVRRSGHPGTARYPQGLGITPVPRGRHAATLCTGCSTPLWKTSRTSSRKTAADLRKRVSTPVDGKLPARVFRSPAGRLTVAGLLVDNALRTAGFPQVDRSYPQVARD